MKKFIFWVLVLISAGLLFSGLNDLRKKPVPMASPQDLLELQPTVSPTPQSSSLPSVKVISQDKAGSASESNMVSLVNDEREKVGASRLIEISYIDAGALKRAKDIATGGQWSHVGYDVAMRETIKYSGKVLAGENLARDCFNNQQVVNAWLNSPSHKAVMLDAKYVYVGFGNYQGICVLWVSNQK